MEYTKTCETVYAEMFPCAEFTWVIVPSTKVSQKRALSPQAAGGGGSSSKRSNIAVVPAVVPARSHIWALRDWSGEFFELSLSFQQNLECQFHLSIGKDISYSFVLEEAERITLELHKDNDGFVVVDFATMTIQYVFNKAQEKQTRSIRRTSVHSKVGKNWVHQKENIEVITVSREEVDFGKVRSSFYSQTPRDKGTPPLISIQTHELIAVHRIQNSDLLEIYCTLRDNLVKRKDRNWQQIMDSEKLLWHGTGMQNPENIATGAGLDKGYSNSGFYGQGNYCAVEASYSHNDRYVHRTSDKEGKIHDCNGKYFHLLLVRVLVGNPLVCPNPFWDDESLTSKSWKNSAKSTTASKVDRISLRGPDLMQNTAVKATTARFLLLTTTIKCCPSSG